ncbi:hypothetical protein JT31_10250 [Cedecea neteri]|uniref:Uncharacterized protein n=1 Tax=Cedecea neteri TaxID=158822 RepID=A0A089Q199_9ENTR|nr:hypothetical protein JT31_10250 [Cedecea neteri]
MKAASSAAFVMHHFGLRPAPPQTFPFLFHNALTSKNIFLNHLINIKMTIGAMVFVLFLLYVLILSKPFYTFPLSTNNL